MRRKMIPAVIFLGTLISIIPNGVCSAGKLNVAFIGLSKATADRIANAYQRYSKTNRLNVRICDISDDMTTVLLDNPTDILISTKEMLTDNADVGIFADLNKVLPKNVVKDIIPTYIEAYSNRGKLYAVPLIGYTYTLFYNKTMFKRIIKYSGAPLIQNYQRGYAHSARKVYRDLRNLWWGDMEKVGKGEMTIAELVNRAKSIGSEQLSKASANIF